VEAQQHHRTQDQQAAGQLHRRQAFAQEEIGQHGASSCSRNSCQPSSAVNANKQYISTVDTAVPFSTNIRLIWPIPVPTKNLNDLIRSQRPYTFID